MILNKKLQSRMNVKFLWTEIQTNLMIYKALDT
jgi:hypothetical protein